MLLTDGARLNGLVREKTKFPEIIMQDGTVHRRAFSRYFVQLISRPEEEALVDDEHIVRDRKAFTKQMLRSFIKNTVTREAWTGAPWLVKPKIAQEYRIGTDIPPHLQYGNKVAEKKANLAMKKGEHEGLFTFFASNKNLPELKPAVKGQKSKYNAQELAKTKQEQFLEYQRAMAGNPTFVLPKNGQPIDEAQFMNLGGNNFPGLQSITAKSSPKPPPPPPIKYPIEDLDVTPVRDGTHRPALKYLSEDVPVDSVPLDGAGSGILMESVGPLLETWNTLNVYCEVFQLDSFTFDDFVEAMQFSSEDVDCELFVEIHCGVLKKLVNGENDQNGAIQVQLPAMPQEESEATDSINDSSRLPTPTPEPEVKPAGRTTRSSLAKSEAANIKAGSNRSRSASTEVRVHRAAEMFDEYGWIQRLRKRDFRNGGWQLCMIGLLHQLSGRPRMQQICDDILSHLAPLDAEPTQETARLQYAILDVNLRVKALQIIVMLTLETKAIKSFMEECSIQMTEYRKEKIEHQRARKVWLVMSPEVQMSS